MDSNRRSRYEMLIRVRNFGATYGRLFPENSTAHAAFSTVATEVAKIEALAVTEEVSSQSAGGAQRLDARNQLIDSLLRATSTARVLSKAFPEVSPPVDVPTALGDRRLLTMARAFARSATPYATQFAAHGIAIEAIEPLIAAYETAVNEHAARRDRLAQTRGELNESLKRARQAVATLDVTVANTLASDPVTLAAWKRERRMMKPRRKTTAIGAEPDATAEAA